jgi:hypothetical protein
MHELVINNFCLKSEGLIEVYLSIDGESISFLILKEELGYKVPGALENLMTENLKRSQSFITLLSEWYNKLPVDLPADLTFTEDF